MGHGFHSYVKLPDGLLLGLPQIRWKTRGTSFQIFDHPSLGSSTEGSSMAFFGDADWCMNQTGDVANKRCDMMWLYHYLITMGLDGFDLVMNRRSPIVSGKRTDMGFHTRKWHKLGLSLSVWCNMYTTNIRQWHDKLISQGQRQRRKYLLESEEESEETREQFAKVGSGADPEAYYRWDFPSSHGADSQSSRFCW